jgi:hypothetical protein
MHELRASCNHRDFLEPDGEISGAKIFVF